MSVRNGLEYTGKMEGTAADVAAVGEEETRIAQTR